MANKKTKQWFFDAPWGRLALVSWGQRSNPPVLLCHGYMDSAATFIPLVEKLPDTYYYVGVDLPGHGLSDPFPAGMLPSQMHMIEVIRIVVERMNWERFIYMSHSMACVFGAFYNAIFPHRMTKVINLDLPPAISTYLGTSLFSCWYPYLYEEYYKNYRRFNTPDNRLITHEQAINTIVRNRNVSEEQAEIILSRCLIPAKDGKFKFSWDPKMKKITYATIPKETLIKIFTTNTPPTLCVSATENTSLGPSKQFGIDVMRTIQDQCTNHFTVFAEGSHDVHITNPDEVASHINEFLKREFNVPFKSKL
ncbi:hypothetical protein JYU34_018227 [Plutella xylostella]|uniref:AB hydrolase-1 domain-containing protein n=1 Tax=Plutella xylostella TaxID=51655 RepID=A0ABQ7Q025_PLUXY|nr:hypothetical protein JYU34_018227 [Plutella xylostella]